MNVLFIVLLFVLQIVYWYVGRRASKEVAGQDDYFLAGRGVRLFPLMMTFLATCVGGGVVLGAAEEAYTAGWQALLFPLGTVLGLMLLGAGVGKRLAGFGVTTSAQIFEKAYGSVVLRRVAAGLSVVSLFLILVAQIVGSRKFLISMGCGDQLLFVLFWAVVIAYTVQGGLRAVISTDVAQAIVFSAVFLGCFGFVWWTGVADAVQYVALPLDGVTDKLCSWLAMPILFMFIEQDMAQRCFAGASPRVVARAATFAGIAMMVVCTMPIFFGVLAQHMGIAVPPGGSVLMSAIAATTPSWITAVVGCAVLAAIISTATSLISAISSNLVGDLFPQASLPAARRVTAVIAVGALAAAFWCNSIVGLIVCSYELSVSCLVVPIVFALFRREGSSIAAWGSVIGGGIGFVLLRAYPVDFPREIASVLLSLMGYGTGVLFAQVRSLFPQKAPL